MWNTQCHRNICHCSWTMSYNFKSFGSRNSLCLSDEYINISLKIRPNQAFGLEWLTYHFVMFKAKGSVYLSCVYTIKPFSLEDDDLQCYNDRFWIEELQRHNISFHYLLTKCIILVWYKTRWRFIIHQGGIHIVRSYAYTNGRGEWVNINDILYGYHDFRCKLFPLTK